VAKSVPDGIDAAAQGCLDAEPSLCALADHVSLVPVIDPMRVRNPEHRLFRGTGPRLGLRIRTRSIRQRTFSRVAAPVGAGGRRERCPKMDAVASARARRDSLHFWQTFLTSPMATRVIVDGVRNASKLPKSKMGTEGNRVGGANPASRGDTIMIQRPQLIAVGSLLGALVLTLGVVATGNPMISAAGSPTASKMSRRPLPMAPTNFDPLTATAAQLAHYGFPPRPSGPGALAAWTTAMKDARHELPGYISAPSASVVSPAGQVGATPSSWAGFSAESSDNSGTPFTFVQGTLVVPSVQSDSSYGSYSVNDPMDAFWFGLGGDTTAPSAIAQAGVLTVAQSTPSYYMFTETTAYQSTPNPRGPVVRPGNTIYVSVQYLSGSGGNVEYYLENESTGTYQDFIDTNSGTDTASVDCVAEWPSSSKYPEPFLPVFSSPMHYTSCAGNGYDMSYWNYIVDGDWCNNFSERIQYPGVLSGGAFPVYWQNYCTNGTNG
jgi:hypothetical protein